ncbi:MAG: hypothetical protein H6733_04390 [Alphaproteobacteria bacterium]|nr:hypothetical protein [Alphaproteobacteria bacterium]
MNDALERARVRASTGALTAVDRALLRLAVAAGVVAGAVVSPEGSAVLAHAVFGDGSDLDLDPSYLRRSVWIQERVRALGPGRHGPLLVPPGADERLSLALQPVYLDVDADRVRVGHPRIAFAAPDAARVITIVPVGRLRFVVPDNLVGALQTRPFAAWATWPREP